MRPRGVALIVVWVASMFLFGVTADEGARAAVGTGTCVTFASAFVVLGFVGWVRDLGRNDNADFRESKRNEHPCFRSWAAAMLPFSWVPAAAATTMVFGAYDELRLTDALAEALFWVSVAGTVLSVTIGRWRQPWFLMSAEARREIRDGWSRA